MYIAWVAHVAQSIKQREIASLVAGCVIATNTSDLPLDMRTYRVVSHPVYPL